MIDRKNWVYPDEERAISIIETKEAKIAFGKISEGVYGMNAIEFFDYVIAYQKLLEENLEMSN